MRFRIVIGVAICAVFPFTADAPAASPFPMGMNLAGTADWSSEIVFVDSFKISRPWISQKEGAAFGAGGPLEVNDRGWVTKLADGQFAEALLHVDIENHYPGGKYVCLFDGKGELQFSNAARGRQVAANKYAVDVDSSKSFIAIRVPPNGSEEPRAQHPLRQSRVRTELSKVAVLPELCQSATKALR